MTAETEDASPTQIPSGEQAPSGHPAYGFFSPATNIFT